MDIDANKLTPKEFDELTVKLCPKLYVDRYADKMHTCMCWGFDIASGWQKIVLELSLQLEELINKLPVAKQTAYKAVQVKEKLGTLRFYISSETDEMYELILRAETASETTCEVCGNVGRLMHQNYWYKTLCDACATKLNYFEIIRDE